MTKITSEIFGKTADGSEIKRYTLTNSNGLKVFIINYGAVITGIEVPDKSGKFIDVACGFDNVPAYEENPPYLGAIIGRVCNKIENGEFELDGQKYSLAKNNGPNCSHGGDRGWDKKVWEADVDDEKIILTYLSKDKEENFPGNVKAKVTYSLTDKNEIVINMQATTDKPSPVSMTNHTYFNLAGHGSGLIYDHLVTVHAEKFTPKNPTAVCTGEIANVSGTVLDLRKPTKIGDRIKDCPAEDMGLDHNFCINEPNLQTCCAKLEHPTTGIVLEVFTDQPGIQLYSANYFDNYKGKCGSTYIKHGALALETQAFPNALHKANFPSIVLRPGKEYNQTCIYKLSVSK